jgi:glutathione S-transferase
MIKLYYAETLAPRKTCALAKYLGAPVEYVCLDLRKGEHHAPAYLAINPNAKVPAMEDGERILWEADAIMCHLAERTGSDLWPRDTRQIDVVRWFSWNAHHFYRFGGTLYFEHIVRAHFGLGNPDPVAVEQALNGFRKCATVLNAHLGGREWLVGDRMTVADFSVAVTLPYAEQANLPLDEFPEVRRWHEQLNDIEAWREPFPATQRGIEHAAA